MFERRKRRGKRPASTHRLRAEALEPRDLLAGDVLVDVSGSGDIALAGDKFANQIAVTSAKEGVLIQGLNGTTITFQRETDESHKISTSMTGIVDRDLTLHAGDGDDTISVSGIAVGRTLRLDMANGNDTGNVDDVNVGAHLRLVGAAGGDTFDVIHTDVTGSITANGGSGADHIEIDFTESAMAAISGGNDDDTFDIMRHNVDGGSFTVSGGDGADNMRLDPRDAAVEAFGGAGDDTIQVEGDDLVRVDVDAGEGSDTARFQYGNVLGDIDVRLRNGDIGEAESVRLINYMVGGNARFRGAAGDQTVQLGDDSQISGAVIVAFGGGDDHANLADVSVGGVATVNLGSGSDGMEILGSTLNAVNVNLGGGEDLLTAASVSFDQPWDLDGGNGYDTFSGAISVLAPMELWNFERVIFNPVIA